MRLILALVAIAMFVVAVGCAPTPEATTPPAGTTPPSSPATPEDSSDTSSTVPDTSNLQLVSLKLPSMACSACEASVRDAFANVDAITDVECDTETTTCSFKVPKDFDVDATLNKIVESGNTHVKGWSKN